MSETVSVVIPLFDKGRHIARALESVRAQTLAPLEVIVVDDGSTDGGDAIAEAFPGVIFLRRGAPGPGGYAARNAGVAHARGDLIAFLDADDEWRPDHLAHLTAAMARTPGAVMASSGYDEHHPGGRIVKDVYRRARGDAACEAFDLAGLMRVWIDVDECPVWTSAIVTRRSALIETGGFPEDRCRRGGDKDLWFRVATLGTTIIDPLPSAVYYKDADNMVTNIRHLNECHCMVPTLDRRIAQSAGAERDLLFRLRNDEMYRYALRTAKATRLTRNIWRGFSFRHSPARYMILLALWSPLGPLFAAAGLKLRKR